MEPFDGPIWFGYKPILLDAGEVNCRRAFEGSSSALTVKKAIQ
jgi:hypothetical protein